MKIVKKAKFILFFILTGSLVQANALQAGVSVKSLSTGRAYDGSKDDLSAVFYNPAGFGNISMSGVKGISGFSGDAKEQSVMFGTPLKHSTLTGAVDNYSFDSDNGRLDILIGWGLPVYRERILLGRRQAARAGGVLKLTNITAGGESASVIATDIGGILRLNSGGSSILGIALKDIGGKYKINGESLELPSAIDFNLSFSPSAMVAFNWGFFINEDDFYIGAGAGIPLSESFIVRAGISKIADLDPSFSAGFGFESGSFGLQYGFDSGPGDADALNYFSLGYMFGKKKEDPYDIESLYQNGKKFYFQGNLTKAREKFEEVMRLNKNYKETMRYLQQIRQTLGKLKRERPMEEENKKLNELLAKGNDLFANEEYEAAIKFYIAVLVIDEDNSEAKQKIKDAKEKLIEKEVQKSRQRAENKEEALEGRIEGYYRRGATYFDEQKYEPALVQFRQGLNIMTPSMSKLWRDKFNKAIGKVKSRMAQNHYERGYGFYQQNNLEEAVIEFKKALSYDPNYADAAEKLTEVKKKITLINKKKAERLYEDGLDAYTAGNVPKAIELWEEALKFDENHVEAQKALERLKARNKK